MPSNINYMRRADFPVSNDTGELTTNNDSKLCKLHVFSEWRGEEHFYMYRQCELCGYMELKMNYDKRGAKDV